jgi:hypothetical protein
MVTNPAGQILIAGVGQKGVDTPTNEIFDYRNNCPIALAGTRNSLVSQNRTHQTRGYFFSGVGFGGSAGSTSPGFWNRPTRSGR